MKTILLTIVGLLMLVNSTNATNYSIVTSGFTYSPNQLTVHLGDVVTIFASTLHPLVQVSKATWDAFGSTPMPGGWGTKLSSYAYTALISDTIYFVCANHVSMGMKGKIIVLKTAIPITNDESRCGEGTVTLTATNGTSYRWYDVAVGGSPVATTSSFTTPVLVVTTTYYVSNIEGIYESERDSVQAIVYPLTLVSIDPVQSYININTSPFSLSGSPSGGIFTINGTSVNLFDPSFAGLGLCAVTYTFTDGNNCSNSALQSTIVFDTTGMICSDTIIIIVNDTTHVMINDTVQIEIIDTIFTTLTDTIYIPVYDTLFVTINDTSYITDTIHFTVNDTIHFITTDTNIVNVFDTIYISLYDTIQIVVYDSIAVTDTLIINAILTALNPPDNVNTIRIFPNPAMTHILIENGNYNLMDGYRIKITNNLGQEVFNSLISQQQFYIDLSGWSGNGTYFVYIVDPQFQIMEVKKIILQ